MVTDTVEGWTIARTVARQVGHGGKPRTVRGWTLTDPEGDHVMIGGHGHVAPTYRAAVLERDARRADAA